jgi:hypothetical protein
MKSPLKQTWEIIFGALLILAGIAGLILPIMPGWALIIPGLIILGKHIPFIARFTLWAMLKIEPYVPLKYRRKVTRFRRAYRRAVSATMRA